MNRRVNGLGVSEAEVQTQGERNIIVNIPKGTNSKKAREQVGTTAKLYFRPVLDRGISGARRGPLAERIPERLLQRLAEPRREAPSPARRVHRRNAPPRRPPPPRRAVPSPTR